MTQDLKVKAEFGGGAELLFEKRKTIDLNLTKNGSTWTVEKVICLLRDEYIKERPELFASGTKIRPGILILINDVDYEILGGNQYELKDNDRILFISTLHGG